MTRFRHVMVERCATDWDHSMGTNPYVAKDVVDFQRLLNLRRGIGSGGEKIDLRLPSEYCWIECCQ
jgi:hypothetical protein